METLCRPMQKRRYSAYLTGAWGSASGVRWEEALPSLPCPPSNAEGRDLGVWTLNVLERKPVTTVQGGAG